MSNVVLNTLVGIGAGVVVVGFPLAMWAGGVWWSGPQGTANVYKQNQDANNRITANATWNQAYQDVQRDISNIKVVKQQYPNASDDTQGFLTTAMTACNNDVQHYNTLQNMTLTKSWRPESVPATIDTNVCK